MSRPSRFDSKKRNADPAQEQGEEQEQETHQEQEPEKKTDLQTTMGNQAINALVMGGKAGLDGGGLSVEKLKNTDQEKERPGHGGDDDDGIEDGPLTALDLTRSWNPGVKRGKDRPAFTDSMPDDDLPPPDEAWLARVVGDPAPVRLPGSSSPDPIMQPSEDVVATGLVGWTRGIGQFTGASLDQRALGYLLRRPPGFLQDPDGRVLVSRARTGAIGMWTLLDTPTVSQSQAAATCAFVDFALELAARERLVDDVRDSVGQITNKLPVAREILAAHLPPPGEGVTLTRLPEPAQAHLLRIIVKLLRLTDPYNLVPSLSAVNVPPPDPDDPLGLDAIMAEFMDHTPDPAGPLYQAAMLGAEKLAGGCAETRVQMAGVATAVAEAAHDWSAGSPNDELMKVIATVDAEVQKCLQLLVEIARASKGRMVEPPGLRNGLTRAAKALAGIHRLGAERLSQVVAGVIPGDPVAQFPIDETPDPLTEAWRNGQPGEALDWLATQPDTLERRAAIVLTRGCAGSAPPVLADELLATAEAADDAQRPWLAAALRTCAGPCLLARGDHAGARDLADRQMALGVKRRNGLVVAEGALLAMEAEWGRGDRDALEAVRYRAGRLTHHMAAPGGLTLLARWQPPEQAASEATPSVA